MLNAALGSLLTVPLSIPSPSEGVWHVGPVPLRGYALCIILGVAAAIWIGEKRWVARGGTAGEVMDIAIWAVPFGIIGGRLYHVATDWELYFGEGRRPIEALYVWNGGLGIWGAIALGGVGAWIGARSRGIRFLPMADALAPGLLVAQAIGRWGNWFNQELFGKPTDLPWGLEVSDSVARAAGFAPGTLFHPTFLYECLWNLAAFAILVALDRRLRLGHGRVLALYVVAYTTGRVWNEMLRIDDVQLENVLGLRWNVWTSIILFVGAVGYLVLTRGEGREEDVYVEGFERPAPEERGTTDTTDTTADTEADCEADTKADTKTDTKTGTTTDATADAEPEASTDRE